MHDAFVSAQPGQAPAAPSAGEEVMNGRQLGIFSQTKWGVKTIMTSATAIPFRG